MNNQDNMQHVTADLHDLSDDATKGMKVTEPKLDGGITDGKLGSMIVPAFTVLGAVVGAAVGAVAAGAAVHQMHKMNNDPMVEGSARRRYRS